MPALRGFTVDDVHVSWLEADSVRLAAMGKLRGDAPRRRSALPGAPRWIPAEQVPAVFDDWNLLAAWRPADPWQARPVSALVMPNRHGA